MRPTAASANKSHDKHDKTEVKSPPRPSKTTAPPKPKTNGQVKKPAAATGAPKSSSRPSTAKSGSEKASSVLSADAPPAPEQTNGTHEVHPAAPESQQVAKETQSQEFAAADKSLPVVEQQQQRHSGVETPPTQQSNGAAASPLPGQDNQQQGAGTTLEATPAAIGEELR